MAINIIASILLLISPAPLVKASSYVVGFVFGLACVLWVVLALSGSLGLGSSSGSTRGVGIGRLVLGAILVLAGIRKFRSRPTVGAPATMPRWISGITELSALKACALGVGAGAANPKNLAVALATGVSISEAGLPWGQDALVIIIFVLISVVGVTAPVGTMVVSGNRASAPLTGWRTWLAQNNAAMVAVLFVVLGFIVIGNGIGEL